MSATQASVHLIRTLAGRELTLRYRGSMLGFAWVLLTPIATIVLLTFVFGEVLGVRWPGSGSEAYPAFLVSALVAHAFLGEAIARSPTLVLARANLVQKTPFPVEILPWVMILELAVPLAVGVPAVAILGAWFGLGWHASALLAPAALLPLAFWALGIGWLLGALGVYLRDLGHLTSLIATGLLFFSPVLYPLEAAPEGIRSWYLLNPLTPVVENLRALMLVGAIPSVAALLTPLLASMLWAAFGRFVFARLRPGFTDVL
jgi:lipopolysaccharide transport system permease protein